MIDSDNANRSSATRQSLSWTIFLISTLGLLLEMILIRWIGTEIRIFAYLQNTVLIVCFLGLGVGCFTCRRQIDIGHSFAALMLLAAILSLPTLRQIAASITDLLSVLGDFVIWEQAVSTNPWQTCSDVALGLLLTLGIMVLLWEVFVPLGRILGRSMDDHPKTIWAYSVNVAGSLFGIWLFVLLSALETPPVVWLLTAGVLGLWFLGEQRERMKNLAYVGVAIVVSIFAGKEPAALEVAWSPYQKLSCSEMDENEYGSGAHVIAVNNTDYQGIFDLRDESVRANLLVKPELYGLSQYDVPLLFHPKPENVLIVGAGAGNDVAGALRGGAKRVTAVEIDPAIIDMGRRYHPERPYASAKVRVVTDDARSFFATTNEKFDLIIFALLDSHTTTAMTNARLDHYVYTRESITRARSLLAAGGVTVLSFEATKPFIADRMDRCLREVFGQKPLSFRIPPSPTGWGGAIFVAGDVNAIGDQLAKNPRLSKQIERWRQARPLQRAGTTRVATDDWPYIYLKTPSIPSLYFLLAFLMWGLVLYGKRRLKTTRLVGGWKRSSWHFFFLGAGFLLLEVQNISKASAVLGNTWLVNAVIISGMLGMILLANFLAAEFPKLSNRYAALCLIGSCLALYFLDLSTFAFLPFATKALLVGTLTTLPMLFSGIIFIDSFSKVEHKDLALGANLMGALVGGMLQSLTFVIGIRALLLVVAALYAAAMLLQRQVASPGRSQVEQEELEHTHAEDEEDFDMEVLPEPIEV